MNSERLRRVLSIIRSLEGGRAILPQKGGGYLAAARCARKTLKLVTPESHPLWYLTQVCRTTARHLAFEFSIGSESNRICEYWKQLFSNRTMDEERNHR